MKPKFADVCVLLSSCITAELTVEHVGGLVRGQQDNKRAVTASFQFLCSFSLPPSLPIRLESEFSPTTFSVHHAALLLSDGLFQ